MAQQAQRRPQSEPGRLWIGFLGGALAWAAHLMLSYALAEWGCASRFRWTTFLGINGTCWLLFGVTLLCLGGAAFAGWTAYGNRERWEFQGERDDADTEQRHPEIYLAKNGLITSGLFGFVILVQSVPIFFFLQGC